MKKIVLLLFLAVSVLSLAGCGQKEKNVEGTLSEIMDRLYEGVAEEDMPMMVQTTEIPKESIANYLGEGTESIDMKEAAVSESMVGSIAHSIVLVRMNENADIESTKALIKEKANPRKWICVEAEQVYVESKGDLVVLIMTNSKMADTIKTNFEAL